MNYENVVFVVRVVSVVLKATTNQVWLLIKKNNKYNPYNYNNLRLS